MHILFIIAGMCLYLIALILVIYYIFIYKPITNVVNPTTNININNQAEIKIPSKKEENISIDQPIVIEEKPITNSNRNKKIQYDPFVDTIHQQIMSSGFRGLPTATNYKLSEIGLPYVTGYIRCPEKTLSTGPWVMINNVKNEMIKGENDLNKLADQCDLDTNCIGYTSYLKDGYLYKMRDKNKKETLITNRLPWIPLYIKGKYYKSCDINSTFNT